VVIPGDPQRSEIVRRLRGQSLPRMPLTGPPYLPEDQIALIERWIAGGMAMGQAPAATPPPAQARATGVTYADVEPIFLQRCVKCHTDGGVMGPPPEGLRLKTREQILAGSEHIVVVPGSAGASELVRRIRGQARLRMPFDGPPFLSDKEIRLISDWIDQGARDAKGNEAPIPAGRAVRLHGTLTAHWALDDWRLQVSAGTRIDKAPGVGDYVEVRGVVRPDGGMQPTRIRPR
jgi:mono/diheme cytochrome c family protein